MYAVNGMQQACKVYNAVTSEDFLLKSASLVYRANALIGGIIVINNIMFSRGSLGLGIYLLVNAATLYLSIKSIERYANDEKMREAIGESEEKRREAVEELSEVASGLDRNIEKVEELVSSVAEQVEEVEDLEKRISDSSELTGETHQTLVGIDTTLRSLHRNSERILQEQEENFRILQESGSSQKQDDSLSAEIEDLTARISRETSVKAKKDLRRERNQLLQRMHRA